MSDKPTLLVTGLSGMIGDRFRELYQHKFEFENIDTAVGLDITDPQVVNQMVSKTNSDHVLHLAAFTNVNEAYKQDGDKQGSCYQINVIGTQNIVTAAKKHNKYLIHISTDFVFDGQKTKPYTEDDVKKPIEWYGHTKALAEDLVQKHLEQYSILRLSYPFRAKFPPKTDLVRKIIKGLKKNNLPPMFADNSLTPTFIDDLCKVFFMFTLKRPKGIYHATRSSSLSSYELATLIKKTLDVNGKVQKGSLEEYLKTDRRPYQKSLKMDNSKLQEELGNPMLSVESALQIMKTQL